MSVTNQVYNLPLEIQTAIAGGYVAYWIAYAGLDTNHRAVDVAFRTFAFGLPAIAAFRLLLSSGEILAAMSGFTLAVLAGGIWRAFGRRWAFAALSKASVLQEDGIATAWAAFIQQPNLKVSQLSVHTKDGRVLYQNAHRYPEASLGGMYFGADGSIVMVVEEEELPDGTEEQRQGIRDAKLGTRVTYVPSDQIVRVNVRSPTS